MATIVVPGITEADLLELVSQSETVDEDGFTRPELEQLLGVGEKRASRIIKDLLKAKKVRPARVKRHRMDSLPEDPRITTVTGYVIV